MTDHAPSISRRTLCGGLAAAGLAASSNTAWAQGQKYPSRTISVVIPTGQGGGAERLARAFDDAWSKSLGQWSRPDLSFKSLGQQFE